MSELNHFLNTVTEWDQSWSEPREVNPNSIEDSNSDQSVQSLLANIQSLITPHRTHTRALFSRCALHVITRLAQVPGDSLCLEKSFHHWSCLC